MFNKNKTIYNSKNPCGFKCRGLNHYYTYEDLLNFNKMLEFFGVSNAMGYILDVSRSWYFALPGASVLEWTSLDHDNETKNLREVTFHDPSLLTHYLSKDVKILSKEDGNVQSKGLYIMEGKTICDETCIFSRVCDGEIGSAFNPSTQSLPCNKFKLNIHEIIKIG